MSQARATCARRPREYRRFRIYTLRQLDDLPASYASGCHQNQRDPLVRTCEFGPADAKRTIALVGGSHSAQWLPALQAVAEERSWRIVNITKSSCRFQEFVTPSIKVEARSCQQWNAEVLPLLRSLTPDLVFTTSTTGEIGTDNTPPVYWKPWRELEAVGIPVVAIRDNPWHDSDPGECIKRHGAQAKQCGLDRADAGLSMPAALASRTDLPSNLRLLDLTDLYCDQTFCPAVIGNVLVYRDRHHFTATYAKTMAPYLAGKLVAAMGWSP